MIVSYTSALAQMSEETSVKLCYRKGQFISKYFNWYTQEIG